MTASTTGPSLEKESKLLDSHRSVIGLDEVGRGAAAGPLVVGAVLLRRIEPMPAGLNDSKRLTAKTRERLEAPIREWSSKWALGAASNREVDDMGIEQAIRLATRRALTQLPLGGASLLVDGPRSIAPEDVSGTDGLAPKDVTCVIGGDHLCASIAAASVLAKVDRDRTMVQIARDDDRYGWDRNKGYLSAEHSAALHAHGPSRWHRISWNLPKSSPVANP